MLLAFTVFELASIALLGALLFLGFKLAETNWSYKISKPHAWEEAVKHGKISKKLKRIERFYRDKVRLYTFWLQIDRLKKEKVAGAFAEVGVYQGETARMMHEMDPSRKLHLFDTFEGFDKKDLEPTTAKDTNHGIDFSDTLLESVAKFIDGNSNIVFHKGYFPATTKDLSTERYAFVHLDADLYNPTLAGLLYFYPLLSPGGFIIVHDYNHTWEGVTKAVDEFSKTISENLIEISDWQGSVMIVKNSSL